MRRVSEQVLCGDLARTFSHVHFQSSLFHQPAQGEFWTQGQNVSDRRDTFEPLGCDWGVILDYS